ncbi:hypothetical protein BDN70DRAFT_6089 [Pholiota conissans]|uniref:Uncharacterized protein n=1 Tax=Pholiota conissans TaxID=109636 RepID=A0A9P6D869_9AGAR|nr:hypothetical protein BDN70DRAFT_6089 [Pholiota conissans]
MMMMSMPRLDQLRCLSRHGHSRRRRTSANSMGPLQSHRISARPRLRLNTSAAILYLTSLLDRVHKWWILLQQMYSECFFYASEPNVHAIALAQFYAPQCHLTAPTQIYAPIPVPTKLHTVK